MLSVHVHPADEGACGWYRLLWPAQQLEDQLDVEVGAKLDCERVNSDVLGDFPVEVLVDVDVVVFQRPCKRQLVEIIPLLQRQGTAVVVEVDDDFHSLPSGHPARRSFAPMRHPDRNWRWLAKACELADLVTCTTQALADRYGAHGRVAVLPNCVPARYLDVRGVKSPGVLVGWTGTPITHVGDLEVCGSGVALAQDQARFRFMAIGAQTTLDKLGVDGDVVGWVALTMGYPEAVAALDVQIVPLAANRFNRAKSALKMMESAALGVVPVMSPSPDNLRMHEFGIGAIAETPGQWAALLTALATDSTRRSEMAAQGREAMRDWTYEANAWRWAEAWTQAVHNRRHGATVEVA